MMRKSIALAAAVGMTAGMLVVGATNAGATELARGDNPDPDLVLTPDQGRPGTTFTVAGDGCDGPSVTVSTDESNFGSTTPSETTVPTDDDGTWSVELTVDHGSVPYQSLAVDATCGLLTQLDQFDAVRRAGLPDAFTYQRAFFDVLPDPTLTLDPTSGPAGSDFTVSGGSCSDLYDSSAEVSDGTTDQSFDPDEDGDWTATFTVPDDAEIGDEITVTATCESNLIPSVRHQGIRRGFEGQSFDYTPVVFTVTGTETTTSTPADSSPSTTAAGAVEATAATPTTAQPTFTG